MTDPPVLPIGATLDRALAGRLVDHYAADVFAEVTRVWGILRARGERDISVDVYGALDVVRWHQGPREPHQDRIYLGCVAYEDVMGGQHPILIGLWLESGLVSAHEEV